MMIGNSQKAQWGWDETGPVWGARAFAPKSGQDHLGLGSVSSDRILPSLSPGINVLTIHPRYWSFYSWVLDDFWATDLPRTHGAFRGFYRPREALFAMACYVCDAPEHKTLVANVVGSRRVSPKAGDASFDPQFDYIKEALGGYGLYYRSAMELTGALVVAGPANGFPFDAPTPIGRALAAAFRDAVSGTRLAATFEHGDLAAPVPRDVLVEFARAACLCQLRVPESHDLPLLQDLFLHSGTLQEITSRSETIRMLLDLSRCRSSEAIGQDDFRQLIYFRELENSQYEARPELVDVARRWRCTKGASTSATCSIVCCAGCLAVDWPRRMLGSRCCRRPVSGNWSLRRSTIAPPILTWAWRCPRLTRARVSPLSLMLLRKRSM